MNAQAVVKDFITFNNIRILHALDNAEFSLQVFCPIDGHFYGFVLNCKTKGADFMCRYGFFTAREAWFEALAYLEDYRGVDSDDYPLPRDF